MNLTWTLLHTAWRDFMREALVGESYLDPAAHYLEGGTW